MTIEKGGQWGEAAPRPDDLVRADSDADLARRAAAAVAGGGRLAAVPAPGGDVLRTLGLSEPRPDADQLCYPFDLGWVSLDGNEPQPFAAHLSARRRGWSGPFAVAMNCAWMGNWYLGPRAHPNDGLLDVTWGKLDGVQRLLARRRGRTGSHLPHPDLHTERASLWHHRFERPVTVFLDGQRQGRHCDLKLWVAPDSFWLFA